MLYTSEEIANKVKDMLHDLTSIEVKIIEKKVDDWKTPSSFADKIRLDR